VGSGPPSSQKRYKEMGGYRMEGGLSRGVIIACVRSLTNTAERKNLTTICGRRQTGNAGGLGGFFMGKNGEPSCFSSAGSHRGSVNGGNSWKSRRPGGRGSRKPRPSTRNIQQLRNGGSSFKWNPVIRKMSLPSFSQPIPRVLWRGKAQTDHS